MSQPGGEQIYATLLLSDSYLPGALVLGHSLRDAGTSYKLAVLVTLDSVSADSISQLQTVFDYVLPVPRIRNEQPANLYLMDRADLHSAFTKINLWKQTQFSKIVYLDADVVAYRAPDELFAVPHAFSAAPDIGWPDIFNTGVMVLTPNMGDYYAMIAMAERGISFDGADQGLLNMHFKNSFNRLSFTYNVTPSSHYQYIPAYRHFQSSISMVHFIGSSKPWFAGRHAPRSTGPYDEMVGRWWAVYDRHYYVTAAQATYTPQRILDASQGTDNQPTETVSTSQSNTGEQKSEPGGGSFAGGLQASNLPFQHPHLSTSTAQSANLPSSSESFGDASVTVTEARSEEHAQPEEPERRNEQPPARHHMERSWDAQRQPPPLDSQPEALHFPATHYEMSQDSGLFVPPARYPSPPKNMWFEVPHEPPAPSAHRPRPIFPWEGHQPRPSRSFGSDEIVTALAGIATSEPHSVQAATAQNSASQGSSVADPAATGSGITPSTPTKVTPANPWTSFPRLNAWDDMPEIGRYVEGLQQHRRVKSQGAAGIQQSPLSGGGADQERGRAQGLKLTDFPTEFERPSLPVTPAPIRRPSFWGDDEQGPGEDSAVQALPAAEGVPAQSEWDPVAQLQMLAKQQSEALLRRLGGEEDDSSGAGRDIPSRPLPFGSENLTSPTHIRQSADIDIASPQPISGMASTGTIRGFGSEGESLPLPTQPDVASSTKVISER